ncbi:MAG: tetratricopeptide repeat protein, partial [Phaeodactylibacter sp.]|nr:tetratricopeptide repeat protein [Phaeodactylibacter sp.]
TDSEGRFGLEFVSIDPGTAVKIKVEKAALEVVNDYDLQRVIIGRKPLLRVYLADKGRLAQAQTELYNISKEALFAEKDAIIARLLGDKQESRAALAELERDLGVKIASPAAAIELLENKIENLEKRLPEFAQQLAEKNLDFASALYIQAYEHFKAGAIQQAIKVLDDAQLEQSYQDALSTVAEGKNLEKVGQELQEKGLLQIDQTVDSYELKAEAFNLLFQYRNALEVYQKIIQILEEVKGEEELELAAAYGEIGKIYQDLGEYANALLYKQKNTEIKEALLTEDDPSLASSYNNLAGIYQDLGEYEKALALQEKALAILETVLESNHLDIATSYNNLALIYQDLGDYKNALEAKEKDLLILEAVLESNHPDIAISYNNLALIYKDLGMYEKALAAQQKALAIREETLESNHPDIGTSY